MKAEVKATERVERAVVRRVQCRKGYGQAELRVTERVERAMVRLS